MIRNIDSVVAVWPIERIGGMKTVQLPEDVTSKLFPEKVPSLDELKRSVIGTISIYSNPILRNARLFSSGFNIPPLQSTGSLQIYTTSMRKLMEGYLVGVLTRKPLFDIYA